MIIVASSEYSSYYTSTEIYNGRGRGRSREGGVNAHTITTRGGGGRGNAVLSGRL